MGISGGGSLWSYSDVEVLLCAELVTPLNVSGLVYTHLVQFDVGFGPQISLARTSVSNYLNEIYGYFGTAPFPGFFPYPLVAD